jgi:hypothetical protein
MHSRNYELDSRQPTKLVCQNSLFYDYFINLRLHVRGMSAFESRYQATASRVCNRLGILVCAWQWSVWCSHESWVYKWSINRVTTSNPICSHSYTWHYVRIYESHILLLCTQHGNRPLVFIFSSLVSHSSIRLTRLFSRSLCSCSSRQTDIKVMSHSWNILESWLLLFDSECNVQRPFNIRREYKVP